MDDGKITGLISMDIKKAFDSISYQILLSKVLNQLGFDDNELNWFTSYLTDREQVCCVKDHISSRKSMRSGVPQFAGVNSWPLDVLIIYQLFARVFEIYHPEPICL